MRPLLLAALLLTGCAKDSSSDTAAKVSVCDEVDGPVTWDNFGRGFTTQYCQSCHSADSVDRKDAPDTIVFDSEDDVWALRDRVLLRAGGAIPTMPPQGGVSEDERVLLEVWLTCYAD